MFERDWDIINNTLNALPSKSSFDEKNNFNSLYENRLKAQKKCKHMWENDTDATYTTKKGLRKCAICGREF